MKAYGKSYSVQGCTCALCRSRGYRKGNGYGDALRASKHRARQQAKREISRLLPV
ncbi:hypothetical protein EDF88_4526 [Buttiauxella sp. BIGb0552]|uniref:hypothetical protein n=1 Tax=Yersinia enterocolitica TaxID=630 RepID=UPI0010D6D62A|nr:hypothetical protein EDF88_4526 [Buttiauxella sp. BIGb0552]